MKLVQMVYEKSNVAGMVVGMTTEGVGGGITMQMNAVGHACRPPNIIAQDFPFLCVAIGMFGVSALSLALGGQLSQASTVLMMGLGFVSLALYIKVPKYSKKALARYEAWARLSLCESCGAVGTPDKKTLHVSNIQDYLRSL